jgi:hypothetical protein
VSSAAAQPTAVVASSVWYDTTANNAPSYLDETNTWVPVRDGNIAVAQATANAALGAATTDGLPPATSPACEMIGGVGAILFRFTPITNANTVTYKVYASTTPAFTADATTLVGTTAGSQLTMRNLNGGAALIYGTTYYGKVIATDADGAGPVGPETFAQMRQVTTPDVSAAYVYAGNIVVDQLSGGTLTADIVMGSTLRTALTGQRVEIGPLGIITYDSSGIPQTVLPSGTGENNIFKGLIESAGITATGAISMRSIDNEVARGAAITLQSGVTASKSSPSVVVDWETVNLDTVTAFGVPASTLGPGHAVAMCAIGARFLVAFKGASSWGYATFNSDGTYYAAGPQKYAVGASTINQIACKSLTSPVMIQEVRDLTRSRWSGSRTFFDDFSGTLAQWTSTTNTAIASGVARISTPAFGTGNMVGPVRTLNEKNYVAKIVPRFLANPILANQSWSFRAQLDANNYIEIALNPVGVAAGNLRFRYMKAGVATDSTLAFDATNHQYFKIEHIETLVQFYTSAGTASPSWVQRTAVTNTFTTAQMDGMHPEITATANGTVIELDIDNVEVNWTERTVLYVGSDPEIPALGTDGTSLWVAELNAATPPAFVINTIDELTMLSTATFTTATNSGFKGNLSGVVSVTDTTAWGAGARWVVASKSGGLFYWTFNGGTGAYEALNAFAVPTGGSKGIAHDGTQFWSLNASGQLAKHTNNTWTSSTDPENWWAAFTWYDSNATGGTHETPMSAQASFAMHKRARYTITSPALPTGTGTPDDADSIQLYIGRGGTVPARTAMWLQGASTVGTNSKTFTTGTFSGTNPPATNNFPTGLSAGKIRNSADTLVISGDASVLADAGTFTTSLTVAGALVRPPVLVRKTADQSITTSTVLISDTHLRFTAIANAIYLVQGMLLVSQGTSVTGTDFKIGFSLPAGAAWSGGAPNPDATVGSGPAGSGNWHAVLGSGATANPYGLDGTAGAATALFINAIVVMSATPGTVALTWAQVDASIANTTTVKTNSYLRAEIF